HSETTVDPCGRLQSESHSAQAVGRGYTPRVEKSCRPSSCATFALCPVPNGDPFAGPPSYCRRWSASRIIFPLPHASLHIAKNEPFRHRLLAAPRFGDFLGSRSTLGHPGLKKYPSKSSRGQRDLNSQYRHFSCAPDVPADLTAGTPFLPKAISPRADSF